MLFLNEKLNDLLLNNDIEVDIKEYKTRDEIPEKYKWNLKDIYNTIEDWEDDFEYIVSNIDEYKNFQGSLSKSAKHIKELFKFSNHIETKLGHLYLYAFLSKDLNLNDTNNQSLYSRVTDLATKLDTASSFIRPELLSIDKDVINDFISQSKYLKKYNHFFENMFRNKEHSLTVEQEKLISLSGPMSRVSYESFGFFKNADIQYPEVEGKNGGNVVANEPTYYQALYDSDREYRKRVYKGFYKPMKDYRNTLNSLFNGNIKSQIFNAKARNYNSTLEASLKPKNIPLSVYDNLIDTVNKNLKPLHRWASIRKRVLGVDKLHPYDSYVTLFPESKKVYSYDEGAEIVKESLKVLGDEYNEVLNRAFDNRWIDVYHTDGKRGGAYSSGTTYDQHPYVLLNWKNQLNDVSTLTHEMGHNMHSYFTGTNQPFQYAGYTIFLAEVASITNEAILMNYLMERVTSKEEKKALIEMYITKIVTTFYRQTRFAEFERFTHQKAEEGNFLNPDELTEEYAAMYQKYWGEDMEVDEEEGYTWARVPHFYYGFYVYQYATGLAAGEAIAKNIKENPSEGVDKLMTFLKAGKSDYSINILKNAGVDMTKSESIDAVINTMNRLLDELEDLI